MRTLLRTAILAIVAGSALVLSATSSAQAGPPAAHESTSIRSSTVTRSSLVAEATPFAGTTGVDCGDPTVTGDNSWCISDAYTPRGLPRIGNGFLPNGLLFDKNVQTVSRAKVRIDLTPGGTLTSLVFMSICNLRSVVFDGSGNVQSIVGLTSWKAAPGQLRRGPCVPENEQLAKNIGQAFGPTLTATGGWEIVTAYSWVQSPPGSSLPFGVLPDVQVSALAFGAIPVTATLHLQQAIVDGHVQPLKVQWAAQASTPSGTVVPGYGTVPDGQYSLEAWPSGVEEGDLSVSLGDVKVDGVPLGVSDTCHASAHVTFSPKQGFADQSLPSIPPGQPGEWQPLHDPAGTLPGTADISPFSGCTAGGEDLSRLFTALVSGSGNPLNLRQKYGMSLSPSWCLELVPGDPTSQVGDTWCNEFEGTNTPPIQ